MLIVTFSDKNYEPFVENLYNSFKLKNDFLQEDIFVYYTLGYTSSMKGKNLITIPFPLVNEAPRTNFYKPRILLDLLDRFPGYPAYCFIDSDAIVGRRIDFNKLLEGKTFDFPLSSHHSFELPFTWNTLADGTVRYNTTNQLCNYYNIPASVDTDTAEMLGQSMRYVQNCFILFKESHRDFIEEWQSICENKYLWKDYHHNYPYQDETAYNVLLWKYKASESLGFILINTHRFHVIKQVEENDDIYNTIVDPELPWGHCFDSSAVMVYHGTKDIEENKKIAVYINENITSNSWSSAHSS